MEAVPQSRATLQRYVTGLCSLSAGTVPATRFLLKKVGLFFFALLFIVATPAFVLQPLPCFVDEHVKQRGGASRNYSASVQDSNNFFVTSDPPDKLFPITRMEGVRFLNLMTDGFAVGM